MAQGLLKSNKTRDGIAAVLAENIGDLEEDMYDIQQEWSDQKETFELMEDALEEAGLRILNRPNLIRQNWWTNNSALGRNVVFGTDARYGGTSYPYLKSYNSPTEYTQTTEPTSSELAECCAYYTSTDNGVTTYHLFKDEDDIKATVADLASADQITELDGEVYAKAIQYAITANTAYGNSEWLMYYNYQSNKYTQGNTCKDYGQLTDLEVGQTYTVSCWGRVISGSGAWIRFAWGGSGYNAPFAQAGKCEISDYIEVSGSAWARYSWTFTFNPTGNWYTETSATADGVTTITRTYNWNKRVSIGVCRKYTSTIQLTGFRLVKGRMWICETYDDLSDALEETQDRASAAEATVQAVQANVQAAICETDSATATANHAVGDVFWLDGVLYKATAAIATGETITPGTNCETTTVEALIAAAVAGVDLSSKADAANPVFTGSISLGRKANTTVGTGSFAVGNSVEASGIQSYAEGYGSIASGDQSHAEGLFTVASVYAAHAEGDSSEATGNSSHAEGSSTRATATGSHAEGNVTEANGQYSHAEGKNAIANGRYSHAEGFFTTASHRSQHVFGEYNVLDDSTAADTARGNYVEIVGKGTANSARSNARTLDWDGNEKIAGSLTLGLGTANEVTITPAQLTALLALLS